MAEDNAHLVRGRVVKLDRGFPLVELANGELCRCKHATDLVKNEHQRAVIGDYVMLDIPNSHDKAILVSICERENAFIRKDPAERTVAQTLAANFQLIIVAQPMKELNIRRLERELVLAHETGARVVVVLTKADAATSDAELQAQCNLVRERVGEDVLVLALSSIDGRGVSELASCIAPGETAVLIGRSGVGKSSLVNLLCGAHRQETGSVREGDGKGRHTTVSREIIALPNGGYIVDMPGVRGLGLWEAEDGIGAAFSDIEELAEQCKFSDCKHINEPDCAVLAALAAGSIKQARLDSYRSLMQETKTMRERKEHARWAAKAKRRH